MNLDQWLGLIRTALAAGGPIAGLLTIYGLPQDKVTMWLGLALLIVPPIASGVWGVVNKTDKNKIAAAGAMEGVQVTVGPDAPLGARQAAADPKVPGVQPAIVP